MNHRIPQFLLTLTGAALLSGCIFAGVAPPRGIIYTDQTAPLFPGGTAGEFTGRAAAHNVLFLAGWGDAGLRAAMQNAVDTNDELESIHDIVIKHNDYHALNILLLYQRYTTITYVDKLPAGNDNGPPAGRP